MRSGESHEFAAALATKAELARFLNVSPRTVDNYVASRKIPFLKLGRLVRFRLADVERALKRYTISEVSL
jgi:excisionase family DNA binding protein